jgi:hypothetical protein
MNFRTRSVPKFIYSISGARLERQAHGGKVFFAMRVDRAAGHPGDHTPVNDTNAAKGLIEMA